MYTQGLQQDLRFRKNTRVKIEEISKIFGQILRYFAL